MERRSGAPGRIVRGAVVGIGAGIVQVVVAKSVAWGLGRSQRANVAPRLVQRVGERFGRSPSRPPRWLLAFLFHFGYATNWGVLYALARGTQFGRAIPAPLGGGILGGILYTLAFSRLGAGTNIGSEPHPDWRDWREEIILWTAALSFGMTVAYTDRWLERRLEGEGEGDARAQL